MSSTEQKHALFVEAYVTNGGNATQAAIKAGYSAKTAGPAGARLLKLVNVANAVKTRQISALAAAKEKTDLTAIEVLNSLARDLRFDPAKLFYTDGPDKGKFKPVWEMDEDTRLALRGVEFDEITVGSGDEKTVIGRTAKVKQPEKTAAREQGMKHFGLYKEDNDQKPAAQLNVLTVALDFDKVLAMARRALPA